MATDPTQALIFSVSVTNPGSGTDRDKDAALGVVTAENNNRTTQNELIDAGDPNAETPPGDQDDGSGKWVMMPTTPQGSLLTSYEWVLGYRIVPPAHSSYADQYAIKKAEEDDFKQRWRISTDAQRDDAASRLEPLPE